MVIGLVIDINVVVVRIFCRRRNHRRHGGRIRCWSSLHHSRRPFLSYHCRYEGHHRRRRYPSNCKYGE